MHYHPLGKSGIQVSKYCLGTWQPFGWQSSNPSSFATLIERALEQGINFFDCAEQYGKGQAESLLARVLAERRTRVVIASKFSHFLSHPKRLRRALEGSLQRLQRDYIDLYYQHWPAQEVAWDDTLAELLRFKDEGKIRAIGVSNWLDAHFTEASLRSVDVVQLAYNLLWRSPERCALERCAAAGVTVLAYSPLCQGLLSGRFRSPAQLPADARQKLLYADTQQFSRVLQLLEYMDSLAASLRCSCSQLALAWLLTNPRVHGLVVGCSSEQQLLQNIEALELALPTEALEALTQRSQQLAIEPTPTQSLWGWHSCARR